MATAIASDSDEEVVFTKPNVAGSAAIQRDEEDASHPKTGQAIWPTKKPSELKKTGWKHLLYLGWGIKTTMLFYFMGTDAY